MVGQGQRVWRLQRIQERWNGSIKMMLWGIVWKTEKDDFKGSKHQESRSLNMELCC